jgi:alkanesulfonate monooxygenase SsuD/methylene tetrahydromethanopterin reductase-like flavin-dependent oxidoreductase (luciferase family)
MKLGMQLGYAGGFREAVDQVATLEKAGLDVVWVAEAYGFDAPTHMGYVAAKTERVQIGSAILPIFSRTPALLAQTAAGLDYVSGGRAILGLGASGPQVIEGWHGIPYDRPLQRTKEIIDICRRVWRREVITHEGSCYTLPLPPEQGTGLGKALKMLTHPVRDRIPIYVASIGPKNVEDTAEVADGWLPIFYVPEKARDVWGEALDKGSANRAADLGPLEVVAGGMGARGRNFYNDLARRYGYEKEAAEIQDLYLSGKKEEAAKAVPQDLLDSMALVGSAGYVKDRIAAYKEAGVTILNINPMGPDPAKIVEQVKEWAS